MLPLLVQQQLHRTNMNRKTLELLLANYQNINNGILKDCAEKQKFVQLIKEVEQKIKEVGRTIVYPAGMTAMEYAIKLAAEANHK